MGRRYRRRLCIVFKRGYLSYVPSVDSLFQNPPSGSEDEPTKVLSIDQETIETETESSEGDGGYSTDIIAPPQNRGWDWP